MDLEGVDPFMQGVVAPVQYFFCVAYRSAAVFPQFADSLIAQSDPHWKCVVLDNSAESEMRALVELYDRKSGGRIDYFCTPRNLGYLPAVDWFLLNERLPDDCWFAVVCNPDIVWDEEFVGRLGELTPNHIPAPVILDARFDRNVNPYLIQPPGIVRLAAFAAFAHAPNLARDLALTLLRRRKGTDTRREYPSGTPMFAPHGSVFVVPTLFFQRGGSFSRHIPLYGEELLIGHQAIKLDIPVLFRPSLVVHHSGSHATGEPTKFVAKSRRKATRGALWGAMKQRKRRSHQSW